MLPRQPAGQHVRLHRPGHARKTRRERHPCRRAAASAASGRSCARRPGIDSKMTQRSMSVLLPRNCRAHVEAIHCPSTTVGTRYASITSDQANGLTSSATAASKHDQTTRDSSGPPPGRAAATGQQSPRAHRRTMTKASNPSRRNHMFSLRQRRRKTGRQLPVDGTEQPDAADHDRRGGAERPAPLVTSLRPRKPRDTHDVESDAPGGQQMMRAVASQRRRPDPRRADTHAQQHVQQPAGAHPQRTQHRAFQTRVVGHDAQRQQRGHRSRCATARSGSLRSQQAGQPATEHTADQQRPPQSAQPSARAMRPDGSGRSGRSRRSSSTSHTSFNTMPAEYNKALAAANGRNTLHGRSVCCTNRNPMVTSANAVKTLGSRTRRR